MNVRTIWCTALVVFGTGAHHNWQDISSECVHEELLGDVVHAIGILECQIEFVVVIEYVEAPVGCASGAFVGAARAVDVNLQHNATTSKSAVNLSVIHSRLT